MACSKILKAKNKQQVYIAKLLQLLEQEVNFFQDALKEQKEITQFFKDQVETAKAKLKELNARIEEQNYGKILRESMALPRTASECEEAIKEKLIEAIQATQRPNPTYGRIQSPGEAAEPDSRGQKNYPCD